MLRMRNGTVVALFLLASLGCAKSDSGGPATGAGTAGSGTPASDAERVSRRCSERWAKVVAADWIEAYDYLTPTTRKRQTLSDYLMGKSLHRYEKVEPPQVLETKDDRCYVYVACLWTPLDKSLERVKLEPGQTMTERLEMVETWRRSAGEWYYSEAQSSQEFFKANPSVPHPKVAAAPGGGTAGTPKPSPQ